MNTCMVVLDVDEPIAPSALLAKNIENQPKIARVIRDSMRTTERSTRDIIKRFLNKFGLGVNNVEWMDLQQLHQPPDSHFFHDASEKQGSYILYCQAGFWIIELFKN